MELINLTPHDINILGNNDQVLVKYPASGKVARCLLETEDSGTITAVSVTGQKVEIPVNQHFYGEVYLVENGEIMGFQEPKYGTGYIVSKIVAEAFRGYRDDIYIVDETVKDAEGRILGCRGLAVL